jgi:ABC-type uncharacterized transport system substrate-binding protein
MSYEEPGENPWSKEIKEGIDSVLAKTHELTYFYMDTKVNLGGGEKKAQEAYSFYQKLQPDGVITADDNAQSMFVLPYLLENKVKVPIMFCGVNASAVKYGYAKKQDPRKPVTNVSGILERGHIRESVAFIKQLIPSIQTIGILAKDSPSGKALLNQIKAESDTYHVKVGVAKLVRTVEDIMKEKERLQQGDAIYIDSIKGIRDGEKSLSYKEVIGIINKTFDIPVIGANKYHVTQGALCAVVKTGYEQGETAAEMLLKAMRGTPVRDIMISQNYEGRRIINVTVMRKMGIKAKPTVLIGTELVK